MNTKAKGNIGEELAVEYLKENGYGILERNVKLADCEVDIVAEAYLDEFGNLIRPNTKRCNFFDRLSALFRKKKQTKKSCSKGEKTLVFVEVKTRETDDFGAPEEAVDGYKKGRYVTAAKSYIVKHSEQNTPVRFDVITVEDGRVNHVENAFTINDARYSRR